MLLYDFYLQDLYEYLGMQPISRGSLDSICIFIFVLIIFLFLFPYSVNNPGQVFTLVFLLFIFIFSSIFVNVSGQLSFAHACMLIAINILPIIGVSFFSRIFDSQISLIRFRFAKSIYFYYGLLVIIFTLAFLAGLRNWETAGFGLEDSYTRRLTARDTLGSGTIYSYAFEMALNGVAPILAFISIVRKKILLGLISFVMTIFGFWAIGTKSPILTTLLMLMLGYLYSTGKLVQLPRLLLRVFVCVYLFALIELFFTGSSVLADLIIRRSSVVVWQNQGYFIDYFVQQNSYQILFGASSQDVPITYQIGELYYNDANINVNVNTFLYSLLTKGILGYLINIFILGVFFALLNVLYRKYRIAEALALSFLISLHMTEQFYLTSFLSSGIALATILIWLGVKHKYIVTQMATPK